MKRRDFIALAGAAASTVASRSFAQSELTPAVGFLNSGRPGPAAPLLDAFRQGLSDAGFTEGRNVAIEYRWAETRYDRLEALAAELAQRNVAVIAATGGTVVAKAARAATSKIPILFIAGFDPKHEGLVDAINRPGTNATGVCVYTAELGPKRLEMLLKVVHRGPIAMLTNPKASSTKAELEDARSFASRRNIELVELSAATSQEIESAFAEAAHRGAKGFFVSADGVFTTERAKIIGLATRHKIAGCYPWPNYVRDGGLMSYGPSLAWAYRQIASYAAQILKGAKVSELPVVYPTTYQTILNMKAAADLAITFPQDLIIAADEVIGQDAR